MQKYILYNTQQNRLTTKVSNKLILVQSNTDNNIPLGHKK